MSKILCRVAGCRRGMMRETAIRQHGHARVSFICGYHWRRLTKAERRVWYRIARLQRRIGDPLLPRSGRIWSALIRRAS